MKVDHILVIRFSAMGDVAMTVPVVYSLAKQYPDVRITVLSQNFAKPFFEHMPSNVGFMTADLKGENHGVKGLNSLFRRLIAKNFTAVADLHNVLRSKYLRMRFNMARFRVEHINKHREQRHALVATKNKRFSPLPTSFDNYADVFRRLGYPVEVEFKSIFGDSRGDLSLLPQSFHEKKDGEQWIGIAPFAAHKGKIYPVGKMTTVLQEIARRHPDCRIMLFGGGEKETQQMNKWHELIPQCENVSSQLRSLASELILMSHLDVMLSMDSSNMHMASIVNTPVVSVWGATHPYAGFMGWGQSADNAVQIEMPCRPCSIYGNKPCIHGDFPCMQNITPESIADRIDRVIK